MAIPGNKNPFNYEQVQTHPGWDIYSTIDPAWDTTQADLDEFGILLFEDHVQLEARHTKEGWQ